MNQTKDDILQQLHDYLEGQLPAGEVEGLLAHLATAEGAELANAIAPEQWEKIERISVSLPTEHSNTMRQSLMTAIADQQSAHRIPFYKKTFFRYAAAIIIIATSAYIWFIPGRSEKDLTSNPSLDNNNTATLHQPGKSGAVLTLADGRTIVLDSLNDQLLATENGSEVLLVNGQLAYHPAATTEQEVTFNALATPKGRQFLLTLPDSSKVWLNAASSIKYPTRFIGKERKVEVSGEAYFEIMPNATMPFIVETATTTVEVLGTSFNLNAYEDEPTVSTTLVDGRVRVKAFNQSQLLTPGQQATITAAQTIQLVKSVDLEEVVAWKNGLFSFNGARIEQVMRQLCRWYNVEVRYEGAVPQHSFVGKINKNYQLSEALEILRASNVNFEIIKDTIVIKN